MSPNYFQPLDQDNYTCDTCTTLEISAEALIKVASHSLSGNIKVVDN